MMHIKNYFVGLLITFCIAQGITMNVTKVIIPAAGFGTRFFPITKSVPKELLPLGNTPALQKVIEEGVAAGIHDFYIITNKEKHAIEHYFSPHNLFESLTHHQKRGLESINNLIANAHFHYLNQPHMLGLGHAVLMAKKEINHEYFGVILPDDIIFHEQPGIGQLMVIAQKYNATVVAVTEVPHDQISAYGSIKPGKQITPDIIEITDIIEKPAPEKAFSNLGIIGRYIFTPAIFDAIEAIAPAATGEIQLTDAITYLAQKGQRVLAYKIKGARFDIGRPAGWLEANIYVGLHSKEYAPAIRRAIAVTDQTHS